MTTPLAAGMAHPIRSPYGVAGCYETRRYETERKSLQDRVKSSSVSCPPNPVDNSISTIETERVAEFVRFDRAGLSAREIAERMNVTPRTVQRWRRRHGMSHGPTRERIPDDVRAWARQLLDDGCSFEEVAVSIGVTPRTVRRWFPDIPAWTTSQVGAYAVQARRFNQVAQTVRRAA